MACRTYGVQRQRTERPLPAGGAPGDSGELSLLVLLALLAIWLLYLAVEGFRVDGHRKAVPLRIAITGTRGKTTVTRMLAAVLMKDGRRVLAKTTGSEAAYLLPDGKVQEIRRRGAPSIIEQKHLLKTGAKLGVDVVLAEVMSVHPENHRVEVQEILQPHLVLVTNFRVDHREAQGKTPGEVASVLALDVPSGVRALVPESEWEEDFHLLVSGRSSGRSGEVVKVPTGEGRPPEGCGEFGPNLDLVWAAARSLGVTEEVIQEGLEGAEGDLGALGSWHYAPDPEGDSWLLVNAFAANDPESTMEIHERLLRHHRLGSEDCVGLLNLRPDRGDRSLQWAEALDAGALSAFRELFVVGFHAPALKFRLRRHPQVNRIKILRKAPPESFMAQLLAGAGPHGGVLFGFGNMAGLGRELVEHWRTIGESHGN